MTLADFMIGAGAAPADWTHRAERDGRVVIYWPGEMCGSAGWWWAVGTKDEVYLAGGWALGTTRDRNVDIALAITRFAAVPS